MGLPLQSSRTCSRSLVLYGAIQNLLWSLDLPLQRSRTCSRSLILPLERLMSCYLILLLDTVS